MSIKIYVRYFFFILRNWGVSLAIFTIYHEIRGEKKYGIQTSGFNNLKKLKVVSSNKASAFIYQPVNYYMAEKAFNHLILNKPKGSFVDYGSGQGRILAVSAHFGFTDITGIEFAPDLCETAGKNADKVLKKIPDAQFSILCMDATKYAVKDSDTVFSFFNPFNGRIMLQVVKNILKSLKVAPRDIYIVYFNPTEKEIFLAAGFTEIWYYEKMAYLDVSILFKEKEGLGLDDLN